MHIMNNYVKLYTFDNLTSNASFFKRCSLSFYKEDLKVSDGHKI